MTKSDLDIQFDESENKRQAFRVPVSNLKLGILGRSGIHVVTDISPTGLGLGPVSGLAHGQEVVVTLIRYGKRACADLTAIVARADGAITGLKFENLDRRQSDAIHAIALEAQKQQAKRRKHRKMQLQ